MEDFARAIDASFTLDDKLRLVDLLIHDVAQDRARVAMAAL